MTCTGFGTFTADGNWIGWVFLGLVVLMIASTAAMCLYKGVVREIVIVKKRETVRDLFDPDHSGSESSYVEMRMQSVDYRVKGKKMLHTKFCNDGLIGELSVGKTYRVRIKLNYITEIISKDGLPRT
ncbi:MAG: hypothetical protein NC299_12220 [Lachnospiraceae bacterium]|nr:hypothetical protein [Ruminococcus sp.]MCM1276107.1 hypothetical protein [Lachnospiraceae bacterium]